MRTHGWVLACALAFSVSAKADLVCKASRPLVIGHTYKLDWFTTFRMKNSARLLGYKIQFKDLRNIQADVDALRSIDALLVPGGADINPTYYTRSTLPQEEQERIAEFQKYYKASSEGDVRDPHEYSLYVSYFGNEEFATLPALGICRGMQMMAVSRGIPLVLDIKAELGIKNRYNRFDRFHVTETNSIMGDMFPAGNALGFKYHHQNPRLEYLTVHADRHPQVRVTATSWSNRITEAIEMTDRPALGIQFHPEKSLPKVKHRIFKWLLEHACIRSQQGASK